MNLRNLCLCFLVALGMRAQQPAVPRVTYFSGTVQDAAGHAQTGVAGIEFSLYEEQHGGTALWTEIQNVPLDNEGHYTVLLGSMRPEGLPLEMFTSGKARWLGVEPQLPDVAEQPRILLVGVPYALKAADADTLGGLPASAFLQAASGRTAADAPLIARADSVAPDAACTKISSDGTATANEVAKFTGACAIEPSAIFEADGEVGIGTATPAATLDVKGAAMVRGELSVTSKGAATAAAGSDSNPIELVGASFNSRTSTSVSQHFRWQAEASGNNTASPSGTLNLLYAPGNGAPAETGLSVTSKGLVTFAAGQTFPGTGTVTGVTAGAGILETGAPNSPELSLNTAYTDGRYLQLSGGALSGGLSLPSNGLAAGAKQLVLAGGNVGIGTATPGAPLEVAGNLKISGAGSSLTFPDGTSLATAPGSSGVAFGATQQAALLKWFPNYQVAYATGAVPQGVAFDGSNIWVASIGTGIGQPSGISKIRASDGAYVADYTGGNPIALAFDGQHMWIAEYNDGALEESLAGDGTPVTFVPVGNVPVAVAFDGTYVWVANYQDGTVSRVVAVNPTSVSTFKVGLAPYALAFDGVNMWVANSGSNNVMKIRPSDGVILSTVSTGTRPQGLAFDGTSIWVTNFSSNNVMKLRPSDGSILGTFTVGTNPVGLAYDGASMWVANSGSNNVTKLRASDGAVLATIAVGLTPVEVAFDGYNVWVVNQGSYTVSKL